MNAEIETKLVIMRGCFMRACLVSCFLVCLTYLDGFAQKPNVLLIVSDDLNTCIGPYMDISKHTPNLDRLADEGVRFTKAYCQYPLCGPSRASFMSGLYPEANGILGNSYKLGSYRVINPKLKDHPSMAGFFREQGYFTARISKIYHMGIPGGIERGEPGGDEPDSWDYAYNVMGPETLSPGKLKLLSPGNIHYGSNFSSMIIPNDLEYTQTDYLATNQAIAILENRVSKPAENARNEQKIKQDAPFFLAVGMVRPHVPLIAPQRCFDNYPEDSIRLPKVTIDDNVPEQALQRRNHEVWKMNEMQQKQTIAAYMASVQFMDEQVGRLLDALDRINIRQHTIVIFISDHGYNLGEHDCWSKVSLWEGSVRVPMIISHPQLKEMHGSLSNNVSELIDLYPTLLDMSGFSNQKPAILQGRSLLGDLTGKVEEVADVCAYTISYGGKAATIRNKNWRYTRWREEIQNDNEELYEHNNDPEELINLADNSSYKETLENMRSIFEEKRESARNKF